MARCMPLVKLFAGLLFLVLYNEWLVYYVVLLQCQWPQLSLTGADYSIEESTTEPLRVMLISDTHLLGSREGHWFDRLRREWQMERAFQTTMLIHEPEQVFILGDLFDEGKWCSDREFKYYVTRLRKMFSTNKHTKLDVVVGNHDIGFHYTITEKTRQRFMNAFSSSSVQLIENKENLFILMNSMAFENDGCSMCREAEEQLNKIIQDLNCLKGDGDECKVDSVKPGTKYSKPIILQHFPFYRPSDANCTGPDSAPLPEKLSRFNPRWDCLDKEISETVLTSVKPRLVFSGHTHYSCVHNHELEDFKVPEWTVPSFSWRNINGPSFLLMLVSRNNYAIKKCYMPLESTVILTYIIGSVVLVLVNFVPRRLPFQRRLRKTS